MNLYNLADYKSTGETSFFPIPSYPEMCYLSFKILNQHCNILKNLLWERLVKWDTKFKTRFTFYMKWPDSIWSLIPLSKQLSINLLGPTQFVGMGFPIWSHQIILEIQVFLNDVPQWYVKWDTYLFQILYKCIIY